MTNLKLLTELSSPRKDLKKEVQEFIALLKTKTQKQPSPRQRQFGTAKGFFILQEHFDKPLEDFKNYI